jgi:CubicO group peptidase (beta-lactamase class C family)
MNRLTLALVVLLFSNIVLAQGDKRLAKIEAELNKVLETWKAPGFAVAVVEKNQLVYVKGFGYADYEKKIPADGNTLYAIGSCSKAFTSALLGVLRSEDKVDFSKSPGTYVPYLSFYNDEMNNNIRVKDLMCHVTGLPRHDLSWYLSNSKSKDSLLMRVKFQEPFAHVRERWYYNNFMFLAQGVIAEKITGKSWEENIREKFFSPLGMTDANLDIASMKAAPKAAVGYELKNDQIKKMDYYDISGMAPAGSINASVSHMSQWLITWINGGKFRGTEIIPAAYVTEAISSQSVVNGALPEKETPDLFMANYGYGWFTSSYRGHYRVEHGGNIDGFSANTSFFPSDSIGIVVLTNQNGSTVPSVVRNIIADRMLGEKYRDWNSIQKKRQEDGKKKAEEAKKDAPSDRVEGTHPSHALIAYTGKYSNEGYGDFLIELKNDSLFARFPRLPKMNLWVQHHHYDVFKPTALDDQGKADPDEDFGQLRITFLTDTKGEITKAACNFEPSLDHPIEFKRTPSLIEVDNTTLQSYVGEYALGGATVKVYIKNEKVLYVFVPGQPEYELLATGKDKFTIKILSGYNLEFMAQQSGQFKELVFMQPNGNFKAMRK